MSLTLIRQYHTPRIPFPAYDQGLTTDQPPNPWPHAPCMASRMCTSCTRLSLNNTPHPSLQGGGRLSRLEPAASPGPAFWNKFLPFFFPNPHFLRYWLLQWQVYPRLLSNRVGKPSQELGFWFVQTPWDSLGWSRGPRQHAGAHWALLKLAAVTDQYVMTQHYNG